MNTAHEAGINPRWDTKCTCMHTLFHAQGQFRVVNTPSGVVWELGTQRKPTHKLDIFSNTLAHYVARPPHSSGIPWSILNLGSSPCIISDVFLVSVWLPSGFLVSSLFPKAFKQVNWLCFLVPGNVCVRGALQWTMAYPECPSQYCWDCF